jgi:NAD-dependent DNA ligase
MAIILDFLSNMSAPTEQKTQAKISMDDDGQPLSRRINWRRLEDRQIDELIGMCKMAIGDGHVDLGEARALMSWLQQNREASNRWPANVMHNRLAEILSDGQIGLEEEGDLIDLLMQVTGQPIEKTLTQMSSTLPLCNPQPEIHFEGRSFCLTGKFFLGPRKKCESMIIERAGELSATPSRNTDFLVIGMIGSSDWVHSTHGRKIEAAVELRGAGKKIGIVSEEHWVEALNSAV